MSKERKQSPQKRKSENKLKEKKGIERYLKSDVEMVDVTEEMMGQITVTFGRPSKG